MSLIKSTPELKVFIPVNGSLDFTNVMTYLHRAERDYIVPVLGKEQYDSLNTKYNGSSYKTLSNGSAADNIAAQTITGTVLTSLEVSLIIACQRALSNFAMMLYVPIGQIQISDDGFHIVSTETKKTAFDWQIRLAEKHFRDNGYSDIEPVYEFLETNIAQFPLWSASTACTIYQKAFLKSSQVMSNYVAKLKGQRRIFVALKPTLDMLEDTMILPILGEPLFIFLKNSLNNPSELMESLLFLIRPALAHAAVANSITDMSLTVNSDGILAIATAVGYPSDMPAEAVKLSLLTDQHTNISKLYLDKLYKYLQDNATSYPLYVKDEVPSQYDNETSAIFIL